MTDMVWAKEPQHCTSMTDGRPWSANVRYTWAGPIDPQLYSNELNELSKSTEATISRLEKLKATSQGPLRGSKPFASSLWNDTSVMFAPKSTMNFLSHEKSSVSDDQSSIASVKGASNFCYLCSTLEEHQQHMLRNRTPRKFVARKPRVVYEAPKPRVRSHMEEPEEVHDWRYKVLVWTGDMPDATTNANVYITIKGDLNVLYKARLCRGNHNQIFCFCRGSKEAFFLKAPQLGNLEILSIEHDGLEKRHSWYCERIEITCMKTQQQWLFLCKNWLSLHHGDYGIQRDILANHRERKVHEYELTIITGTKRLAGTDANVFVTFHGTEGSSPKIKLTADSTKQLKSLFQRGNRDKFHITFKDLGNIMSVKVEHDGKGIASGWHLDKLILQDIKQPSSIYYFLLNGWLARDVGDGHLWREIRAKKKLVKEMTTGKPVSYQVTVHTGDVRYAGTNANVYIIVQGKKGKTKKLFMDDARDNFERGTTEVFELTGLDTGPITRIQIGHDNSGPGAGWYCENVKIRKYLNRENVVDFLKNMKKLRKMKSQNTKSQKKKRLSEKIRDRALADIQDDVQNNDIDDDVDEDVDDEYSQIFDKEGKVSKVPVYEEYDFVCKNWLATDEADGLIERELEVKQKQTFFEDRDFHN